MLNKFVRERVNPTTDSDVRRTIYSRKIDDPLEEEDSIVITGLVSDHIKRIEIDFYMDNAKEDIAINLDINYLANTLKLNSRINGMWGMEKKNVSGKFYLIRETDFEIKIHFGVEIGIAFDNNHLTYYKHRAAFNRIRRVEVRGEISSIVIERRSLDDYPDKRFHVPRTTALPDTSDEKLKKKDPESGAGTCGGEPSGGESGGGESSVGETKFLSLPYWATISSAFFEVGRGIVISGKVGYSPQKITVRLQLGCKVSPPPTIPLQLEARFNEKRDVGTDEPVIVFNSLSNESWNGEVKCELENGLQPGGDFQLRIVRGARSFQIYINKRHIHNYPYVTNPRIVDKCCVGGDIQLIAVVNENEM